jgi:hypothetical protein
MLALISRFYCVPIMLRMLDRIIVNDKATPEHMATLIYGSNSVLANRCSWPPRG